MLSMLMLLLMLTRQFNDSADPLGMLLDITKIWGGLVCLTPAV
jgi:hypothetical protein